MLEAVSTAKPREVTESETLQHNQRDGPEKEKITPFSNLRNSSKKGKQASQPEIERVARSMDQYIKSMERDLEIQVHKGTGNIMVKVISRENGKVIREFPPEELLNLAARMERMVGGLVNRNA